MVTDSICKANYFTHAKWIWLTKEAEADEYAEFVDCFEYMGCGSICLKISADSNYAAYVNGQLVACGQYNDFPHYKIHDNIDISQYCKNGNNRLAIIVWYYGIKGSITYYKADAGLIYQVECGEKVLCFSDESTLSRLSRVYENHKCKMITWQMGLSFSYNSNYEDNWINNDVGEFKKSRIVNKVLNTTPRPCFMPFVSEKAYSKIVCKNDKYIIFDMKKEIVGLLSFKFFSSEAQEITICFGERLTDGRVKRIIEERDFSLKYTAKKGENLYLNPFRHLGARFIEINYKDKIQVDYVTLVPRVYPSKRKPVPLLKGKWNELYNTAVYTLELCRSEHYEDCPWREQGLYALDSRNQMLFGYYAFEGFEFARANLRLLAEDKRKDFLLSLTAPGDSGLVIPSFSLHFINAVAEYTQYSGDETLANEIFNRISQIIFSFVKFMNNGLVESVKKDEYWHFYEWRYGLDGMTDNQMGGNGNKYDLILNCLFVIALKNYIYMASLLNKNVLLSIKSLPEEINNELNKKFFNRIDGLFCNGDNDSKYSVLGNSLAVLCGAAGSKEDEIKKKLLSNQNITEATLPMLCFKYDALLKNGDMSFAKDILDDIEKHFKIMLDSHTSTLWETEDLYDDFGDSGSMCHGWSSFPVYYLNILKDYI